ncbi:major core protein 4a precursor [BeAn 58058 virus]|uniref:major core protein 4a precursor n=1 Tax=BeAn 58058 virus TaxID=67082 RepID=UPI0009097F83|nr:major core protein 4a precursor [BeAn 58058 virus]APG58320.1 major core protein 4a precursor [BeAn 58058 virus]
MMPISSVTTLDQLEDSEYLFKVISAILPSICLEYKIDEKLMTSYVHPFDILMNEEYGKTVNLDEAQSSIEQIGINYLLDSYSNPRNFKAIVLPGKINFMNLGSRIETNNNPILNTHTFNDLPVFTKNLVLSRLNQPEYISRFIGGYTRPSEGGFDVLYDDSVPKLTYMSFENTYILNLLYKDVFMVNSQSYRVRKANGVMVYRDFENLLGVRSLLNKVSVARFDEVYSLSEAAAHYNVQLPQPENPVDLEFLTMSFKYLVLYYQYFSIEYTLAPFTYNGDTIVYSTVNYASLAASMRFQDHIDKLLLLYPDIRNYNSIYFTVVQGNNNVNIQINLNIKFVDISSMEKYYLLLLNMLAKEYRSKPIKAIYSMFWDGIDYDDYKSKKISDIIFYNATCYIFGLYNKNNITYCSLLSDIIKEKETPIRVCFLPRVVSGKTVPKLMSDILNNINNISAKDFPKKSSIKLMHIGLSENNFMRFFQLLRLFTNKDPVVSIKEILMLYIGFKLDDSGSPHMIKKESYQDFCTLLFSAMGFKVTIRKSIIGSNNHTVINIRPRVTKQYINNMLLKGSCSKEEANKIISAAHDLLHFMVSTGDYRNYQDYYTRQQFFPNYFFYGGGNDADTSDETTIHISEPINILDRINVRGIFSADTLDEMINVDAFAPENIIFKNNLHTLIETNNLTAESVIQTMPLNIIDKIVIAGAPCNAVSFNDLIDNITQDTEECDSTNDITELINNALKDNYAKINTAMVTNAFNSVSTTSQKQLNDIKNASCQMSNIFKELSRSIYTVERIFNTKLSDDIKLDILEKLKAFSKISKSLYKDLISIETLKAILYIIRRNGRVVNDVEIGSDEIRKSYEIIRPKIINMTNYYNDMSRSYFEYIKKNLNMSDGNLISFDSE